MEQQKNHQGIKSSAGKLLVVTILMFGFGFAMVPLYDVFCEITGLNGKTNSTAADVQARDVVDTDRTITVQFLTNITAGLPWRFYGGKSQMEAHPGKVYEVMFYAENTADHEVTGQAVPSVSPGHAAVYFNKTECFCFTQQTLAAGEKREMPLRFIINPALDGSVEEMTLSYTFFSSKKPS